MTKTECIGCNRDMERTERGWRKIVLVNGACRACREALAEMKEMLERSRPAARRIRA